MTRWSPLVRLAVLTLISATPAQAQAQADAWWTHVTRLAADSMRGRETGSREHRLAAEYIAAGFQRAGLQPAGTDGFFQPVRFTVRRIDESRSSMALVRSGAQTPVVLGDAALIAVRASRPGRIEAELVFIGYGLQIPALGIDDLAGLDLRGKVVVTMGGGVPKGVPGPALADARQRVGAALLAAGAVGAISIASPKGDVPWDRQAAARLNPQMVAAGTAPSPLRFAATFNSDRAEMLFTGTAQTYAALQQLAEAGEPLPRIVLPTTLSADVGITETEVVSDNVVGLLPGTDPVLKDEYIVLSAHLDHVGVGAPVEGDSIFNGAMDNASGIATMLETAGTLGAGTKPLKRSVLFVAVTAEEKGLLGSNWFATHPTVPASAIAANLNTDMFLPINPLKLLLVNGLEESDLADDVRRAGTAVGVEVVTDPEPERNAFVRSDQYSFIRNGVPSLSLKVGFRRGSPEHDRVLAWRRDRYHGVRDDLTQPVDRQAAVDFNGLYVQLVQEVANRSTRPAWFQTSIFKPKTSTP